MDWGYDLWAHTGFIDKPHFQDDGTEFTGFTKKPLETLALSPYTNLERLPVFSNYDEDQRTKELIEV